MARELKLLGDFDSIFDCWNRASHFDLLPEQVFRDKFADSGLRETCTAVEKDQDGIKGFGAGVIRERDGQLTGHIKFLAVDPAHQREGVGTRLLDKLIQGLKNEGAGRIRVAEASPNYLTPGLDARYTSALFLFEKFGFAKVGEAYNMEVPLHDNGFPMVEPEGICIRRASSTDIPGLRELLSDEWAAWLPEVELSLSREPVAVHVAMDREEIVAFAAYEGNNAGLGMFGPMGTRPQARGNGFGEILLKRCLNDLHRKGFTSAVIPWVAPIGFYTKTINASISRVFTRLELRF